MEWFKFYGSKWLSDLAIKSLSPEDRLYFITLLCLTSTNDDSKERTGIIDNYSEEIVAQLTGLPTGFSTAKGFTKRLEKVGLIEVLSVAQIRIKSFNKRQTAVMTSTERSRKHRAKQKMQRNATDATLHGDGRVEKSRVEKNKKINKKKYGLYKNVLLTDDEKKKLKEKFGLDKAKRKVMDMDEAIEMKGYKYKSHYLAILKWDRDNKKIIYSSSDRDKIKAYERNLERKQDEAEFEQNSKHNKRLQEIKKQTQNLF